MYTFRSNLSLLGALALIYPMAVEQGGEVVGWRTLLYLCLFPAFIILAIFASTRPWLHQAILIIFPFVQATFALLFLLNRWMV